MSINKLESKTEFNNFLEKLNTMSDIKYIKPNKLQSNELLIKWPTPLHLFEDLMFKQINQFNINLGVCMRHVLMCFFFSVFLP